MKAFEDFIKKIKDTDKIAVVHHTDCDGICSGFIIKESLKRLGKDVVLMDARAVSALNSGLGRKLRPKDITKTIFVDLIVDQMPDLVEEISKFSDVLIIDHHKPYDSKNNVIKPDILGIDYYYPASKLVYDLFLKLIDISDLDWVAAVGLVGDSGYPQSKDFVDAVLKKYNITLAEDIFDTEIGKAASYLTSAGDLVPNRIALALRILSKSNKPQDILNSELAKTAKIIEKEIERQIDFFKKNAEKHGDLLFSEIKTKFHVRGTMMSILASKYITDKTVVLMERDRDKCLISARRQDGKVKVNELLSSAVKGLDKANGGGHDKAAGAVILAKDLAKFKENLIKLCLKKID